VASVDGRTLPQDELDAARRPRQRDSVLSDWPSAAEAAWTELAALFPEEPRQCIEVHDSPYACLDEALAMTYARLADCDPCIDFCGVPGEALYGFALKHADGGRGQLISRKPGTWALSWQSPASALHQEWAMVPPGIDAAGGWVCAGATPRHATVLAAPIFPVASTRRPRKHRVAERRREDRRHADRPPPDGRLDERRHGDRRQRDRRRSLQGGSAG
jgi:hypothetical protein